MASGALDAQGCPSVAVPPANPTTRFEYPELVNPAVIELADEVHVYAQRRADPQTVVEETDRVADEVELDRLTLAQVAQRRGVALPSLYKHVRGLNALLQKLSALATAEIAAELSAYPKPAR